MMAISDLAQEWLRLDKDSHTRAEIQALLDKNNHAELENRLRERIAFGTAGLRSRMEAGFSRMNALTVIQTSQGLAAYLLKVVPSAKSRGVVIGYDARHNSTRYAKLAAAAFLVKGMKVLWNDEPVHTPSVPYGVKELCAAAGIMITASHNPAHDNGYKVYWSNGCQIIPPHDANIAASILSNLEPISWDENLVYQENGFVEQIYARVFRLYCLAVTRAIPGVIPEAIPEVNLKAIEKMEKNQLKTIENQLKAIDKNQLKAIEKNQRCFPVSVHEPAKVSPLPSTYLRDLLKDRIRFVYTPMHGVGSKYMGEVAKKLHLDEGMVVVSEQAAPNPDFPTVKFPNPEEKGAFNRAQKLADRVGISMVIANDPDADRLAVAEKVHGTWHQLTGNQLGILLASRALTNAKKAGNLKKLAMLNTTVSTAMLRSMAKSEGFHYEETLTGFKWLGNKAIELETQGFQVELAFEEAIGYMIPKILHDKDGISAAALFLIAMYDWKKKEHLTPLGKLQQLYKKYGYFETANTYLLSPDPVTTGKVFAKLRELGDPFPSSLGDRKILRWRDLTRGYDSGTDDHVPLLPVVADGQMITCELEGQVKFTIRSSGTEPKIKVYIECQASSAAKARTEANQVLDDLYRDWLQPEVNGLRRA